MKRTIIFGVVGFAIGSIAGGLFGYKYGKKKEKDIQEMKDNEDPLYVHLEYFDKNNEENTPAEPINYNNISKAELEHPKDDDEEDVLAKEASEEAEKYRKEHAGKIELMKPDEWDSDFPVEDYDPQELWFFPMTNELTDEDGEHLEPMEKYVGYILNQINFAGSVDKFVCIRNHPLEKRFKIWKEDDISSEEFFAY